MSFALFPPEVNSGLIYAGPGSGALLAAATAWDSLAEDLASTGTSYQSVIANLTSGPWLGPSSAAMVTAAAPYVAWLHATAGQVAQVGAQAKVAAGAFETARTTSVPPPVIASNRALLAALVATNLLGQNTPAIAATEMHYLEMWVQDGLAMDTYAVSSQQATALPQHSAPPVVANGAMAPAAVAATQSAGTNTAVSGLTSLLGDLGLSVPSLSLPTSLADVPSWLTGALGSLGSLGGTGTTSSTALLPLQAGYYGAMLASMPARMFSSMGNSMSNSTGLLTANQSLLNSVGQFVDGKMQAVLGGVSNQLRSWGSAVSAQLASAHRVGGLSVPQAWSSAAPAMTRAAPVLPDTSVSAPTMSSGLSNSPFAQALMGALSGRGLGNLGAKAPKMVPRSPAGG
jgi:PPE-repeat protein